MNLVSLNDLHPFALMFSQDISGKVAFVFFVLHNLQMQLGASLALCMFRLSIWCNRWLYLHLC